MKISRSIDVNIENLNQILGVGKSYDIVCRKMNIASKKVALYYVNGMVNHEVMTMILHNLDRLQQGEIVLNTLEKLFYAHINHIQVEVENKVPIVVDKIMSGQLTLLIDSENEVLIIDVRNYPARQPQEPDLEKVVRGSRDGFVETLLFNTALLRRRIREPSLKFELVQRGVRSKTDIVVAYIDDIANSKIVNNIKERIMAIDIDGLPMAEKAVEELITPGSYWNPFPKIRYTERPDVAAVHLLEGRVLIMVDTSPSVIIVPCTLWDHMQHAEEFRQNPTVGIYVRWIRYIGILASVFLIPLWFLFAMHPELLPSELKFIGPREEGNVPLFIQFIIAELAVDWVRLAAIHTPTPLATSLGIIGAILVGEVAVKIGLFMPEVVMYTAVAMVGIFLTPSIEVSWANRLVRIFLLIAAAIFGVYGLIISVIIVIVFLAKIKSIGVSYL